MSHTSSDSQFEIMTCAREVFREIFQRDALPEQEKKTSAHTLLKYAGTWVGNDLEDCLEMVMHARGEAHF